jgi:hypothetical protein
MGTLILTLAIAGIAYAFSATTVDGIWGLIDDGGGASYDTWATGNGDSPNFTDGDSADRVTVQNQILLDENQVRYGSTSQYGDSSFGSKSGFGFDGNNSIGTITPNLPFYLGEFTHYNNPIYSSNSFNYVDLGVTVTGVQCADGSTPTEGSTFTFTYRFLLDETSNTAGTCVYPGTSICPDKVTVDDSGLTPSTFTCVENSIPVQYTVQVLGFADSPTNANGGCLSASPPSTTTDEFITEEQTDNYACLWAQVTKYEPPVDLTVTKSDDGQSKYLYEPFWFDINVQSVGVAGRVAQNVVVTDQLDPWLEYLGDEPGYGYIITPSEFASKTCTWQDDNSDGLGGTVTCNLGAVDQGDSITISLPVRAVEGVPLGGLTENGVCQQNVNDSIDVCNLVSVTTTTFEQDLSDNSDSEPKNIVYPTAVDVGLLEAEAQTTSILVSWETFNEMDIQGFNLYRTTNPDGTGLEKLNPDLIATKYEGSSGIYEYTDQTALFGVTYYYKLEVIYFTPKTEWLDAVSSTLYYRLFMPMTIK